MANFGTVIICDEIRKEFIAASGEVRTCFGYGGKIRNCPLSLWGLYEKQMISMSWNGRRPHKYAHKKSVKSLSVDRFFDGGEIRNILYMEILNFT